MTDHWRGLQARFHAWMIDDALPLWSSVGRDAPGFGFQEQLTLEGRPGDVAFKRMRAQARQIYVFSHASVLGWPAGMQAAGDGLAFISEHGSRPDGAWVRVLGRHGGVLDPAVDLYDLAFVLLGLAWHARATGETAPLVAARRTAGYIRTHMAAASGGYHNVLPPTPGHRQQNPHMHLLEACLALYEASQDELYAELAHELVGLFQTRFHHPETGTLGEFFDDALQPAEGEAGGHLEPGHHYEWVWLLDQYARLFGIDHAAEIDGLYDWAEAHGSDATGVAVVDVVGRDRVVRRDSMRLWCQTEGLRAHAVMWRRGRPVAARVESALAYLLGRHLADCPRGTWRDHFDATGHNISGWIPASSLYHIFTAYAELHAMPSQCQARPSSSDPSASLEPK